jgi:hypothetical protein
MKFKNLFMDINKIHFQNDAMAKVYLGIIFKLN